MREERERERERDRERERERERERARRRLERGGRVKCLKEKKRCERKEKSCS